MKDSMQGRPPAQPSAPARSPHTQPNPFWSLSNHWSRGFRTITPPTLQAASTALGSSQVAKQLQGSSAGGSGAAGSASSAGATSEAAIKAVLQQHGHAWPQLAALLQVALKQVGAAAGCAQAGGRCCRLHRNLWVLPTIGASKHLWNCCRLLLN